MKAGYSPAKDVEGAYASVSLGCRLRLGNSCGLSLSIGSEIQSAIVNYTYVTYYKYKNNTYDYSSERKDIWGLFTKIGIDF